MKSQSYMTRALKARDPRFARILGKLGYETKAPEVEEPQPEPADEIKSLRAQYEKVVGKRPFNGWDAETLRAKIAESKG